MKIGFLVNPIAGMGGKVGLKGTDGCLEEAIKRGAKMVAKERVSEFLNSFKKKVKFITCPAEMGESFLKNFEFTVVSRDKFSYRNGIPLTSAADTKKYVKLMLRKKPIIIVFAGGDGTAHDIYDVIRDEVPMLGIPTGVKVFSGVFAGSPEGGAELLTEFLEGKAEVSLGEIVDVDEESYRMDNLKTKLTGYAKVPYLPGFVPGAKEVAMVNEEEEQKGIAEKVVENLEDGIYVLCPGTSVKKVAELIGLSKTLLGVDIIEKKGKKFKMIKKDAQEKDILAVIGKKIKIILSPIGHQGFILGRGNQQVSGEVLKRIDKNDLIVIATRRKLENPLRVDVNPKINDKFSGYIRVITSYTDSKIQKVV